MKAIIFLCCFLALSLSGCKYGPCPGNVDIPFWVVPIKEEYHVGDTITFYSKFPAILYDEVGFEIDFRDVAGRLDFRIVPLDSSYYEKGTRTSEYLRILNEGEYGIWHLYDQISDTYPGEFICNNDSCEFRIAGVAIKPGIVRSSILVKSSPPENASSNCKDSWSEFTPYRILLNDGINYNLYLAELLEVPGPYYFITNPEQFNQQGSYLFRIVE